MQGKRQKLKLGQYPCLIAELSCLDYVFAQKI